jgi:hypothetical protein
MDQHKFQGAAKVLRKEIAAMTGFFCHQLHTNLVFSLKVTKIDI